MRIDIPAPSILSLYDLTGVMVDPWLAGGFGAVTVDIEHPPGVSDNFYDDKITIGGDIRLWYGILKSLKNIVFVAAFPPCTDLAVSGARWFAGKRHKDPFFQEKAMTLVYLARDIAEYHDVPYMIENPVSVISSKWRKPDYYFHPYEYAAYDQRDRYTKKTCLWTGGGFIMPKPNYDPDAPVDNRIHWASPGPDRARIRSNTPRGFALAVFEANTSQVKHV
jgi:hypothetical protein